MNQDEFRSVGAEYFATKLQKPHDRVRKKLHDSSLKYKNRVDQKRREVQFKVGDEFLAHLRKERFPRGTYKNLKMNYGDLQRMIVPKLNGHKHFKGG